MPVQVEPWLRIHEVFHPTDMSPGSEAALVCALKMSSVAGARLTVMRVGPEGSGAAEEFPDVRAILARWGQPAAEVAIRWLAARGDDPAQACLKSLQRHPAELIVVATHQQDGQATWLGRCVAEPLARSSGEMTLLVPEGSGGFVRRADGTSTLRTILVPVAVRPRPEPAIEAARRLMQYLPAAGGTATVLHVGDAAGMPAIELPELPGWRWNRVAEPGEVVETILRTAVSTGADLMAMTTEGRHGFLGALRGSTTQQVLRKAICPLLTMPVGSFLG